MADYGKLIKESESELLQLEESIGEARWRDHVRFLRFLKSGRAKTLVSAAEMVGLKERQSRRLWARYKSEGLEPFGQNPYRGRIPRLAKEREDELIERLKQDDIGTLKQASDMIREEFQVELTEQGVWMMFSRMGIKLKTGRPTNVRKDPEEEAAFKKTSIKS